MHTHTDAYSHSNQLFQMSGPGVGSQVDMHTWTNACIHPSQDVGPRGVQEICACLHASMLRGWQRICKVDIHPCTNTCTYSNQDFGSEER